MTHDQHRAHHRELLNELDELVADYWQHHAHQAKSDALRRLIESELTIRDLMEWAHQQAQEPSESGEVIHSMSVCAKCGVSVAEWEGHRCFTSLEVSGP